MRIILALASLCVVASVRETADLDTFAESQASVEVSAASHRFFGRRRRTKCPPGLKKNQTHCLYTDPDLYEPNKEEAFDLPWSPPSAVAPLIFHPKGGHFMLESAFLSELAIAASDKDVTKLVITDLANLEVQKNVTFKEKYELWKKKMATVAHDMAPVEFLLHETALHAVLHYGANAFHIIAHAAHHSHIVGHALFETVFGNMAEIAHFYLDVVFPMVIVPQIMWMLWKTRKHYLHKSHHVKSFVMRLVMRSECVKHATALEKSMVSDSPDLLKDEVRATCGHETSVLLAKQMQRANVVMHKMFDTFVKMGKCLWPAGKKKWAKVTCGSAVYWPLRSTNRLPGILFEALTFSAIYAHHADQMLATPIYEDLILKKFDIDLPGNMTDMLHYLEEAGHGDVEYRAEACSQTLSMHRAYERTFARLSKATEIWLETYARKKLKLNVVSSWKPCKKVFYSVKDAEAKGHGFCKSEDFKLEGQLKAHNLAAQAETDPCNSELEMPHWHCHHYKDGQDDHWCATVGEHHGHQFSFGVNGRCGKCWCCSRPIVQSLWPESEKQDKEGSSDVDDDDDDDDDHHDEHHKDL